VNEAAALSYWQGFRQGRVDQILKLNDQIDRRRMPAAQEDVAIATEEPFELQWLSKPDFQAEVEVWVNQNAEE